MRRRWLGALCLLLPLAAIGARPDAPLRFEVRLAPGFKADVRNGRVLVVLSPATRFDRQMEPRRAIGDTGKDAAPLLGADAHDPTADGVIATLDASSEIFPIENLAKLKPGNYLAQAVVRLNRDLNYPNAPGDLYGKPQRVDINPLAGGVTRLEVSARLPDESMPPDTSLVKYLRLPSKLLSEFHGRPMFLRAAVILPRDYEQNTQARYPLRVHIGGYGQRFTSARGIASRLPATPALLTLVVDGAGPFGDPYYVNSANNGPYGDALTQELIPYVEKTYRGVGAGHARFTDGHSTGGWVSFALQVFYPDFFNGCWSFCPDPVDFRAFEVINIYDDANFYVNAYGFDRPAKRTINGDVVYTVRHEAQVENVLGRGNRWVLSGKDWGAWNATFGPRGPDGLPRPLFQGKSGSIDKEVAEHYKKYDLRRVMQSNWATLGPKLRGKIHVYAGDADDYFLNNAARLMDRFLKSANPPADATVIFGPYVGHGFHPLSESQTVEAMWTRFTTGGEAR